MNLEVIKQDKNSQQSFMLSIFWLHCIQHVWFLLDSNEQKCTLFESDDYYLVDVVQSGIES